MCAGRSFAAFNVSSTASAIACTCRAFCPEHNRKKSVNAGVCRRSSTTTSPAFLSSAARTAFAMSPVSLLVLVVRRFSVFAMQLVCRSRVRLDADVPAIQPVLMDVSFDGMWNEAADTLAAKQLFANAGRRHIRGLRFDKQNRRSSVSRRGRCTQAHYVDRRAHP